MVSPSVLSVRYFGLRNSIDFHLCYGRMIGQISGEYCWSTGVGVIGAVLTTLLEQTRVGRWHKMALRFSLPSRFQKFRLGESESYTIC